MSTIIIASGPVIVEDNKVLLVKHGEDSFWKFCGGRVEDRESNLRETACREVREEMGIEVELSDDRPYFFYSEKIIDGRAVSVILAHFLAKRKGKVIPGDDIRDWRWLDLPELEKEDLAQNIKPTLKHFGFL